ncbi:hypothetical protein DX980_00480 (plasmid) [Burkholderia gladioli]|uniref:hypothetical protein n=1 Tax=Burkholderia gladioli TaxID=28095 RepID=UPI001364ABAA|nr:hypothetical protein [Burkholderia gladioli]KAF1065587.1 hypothetical protein LvStA_00079 [Burkholderia gladioli]WAG17864.1 hypothetical protein DX980_00480 [Burkholderia gladioli]
MQHWIFGRQAGADDAMKLLAIDDGASPGTCSGDLGQVDAVSLASTRYATRALREVGYERYVRFAGDPTPHAVTPEADFIYPAACH